MFSNQINLYLQGINFLWHRHQDQNIEIAHQEEDRRRDEFDQEIKSLRPGVYDIESPKHSGMRRRQESIRRRLKKIINEDRF